MTRNDDDLRGSERRRGLALTGAALLIVVLAVVLGSGRAFGPRSGPAQVDAPGAVAATRASPTARDTKADAVSAEIAAPQGRRRAAAGIRPADDEHGGGPLERRRPRAGSERAYYEALVDRARRHPDAFEIEVDEILTDTRPLPEQVAALRAWHDAGVGPGFDPCARTLRATGAQPELRQFALRFLDRHARRDAGARRVLADYLATRPAEARDRAQAIFGVLRWAPDAELQGHLGLIYSERDTGVLERAVSALEDSDAHTARFVLDDVKNQIAELDAAARSKRGSGR